MDPIMLLLAAPLGGIGAVLAAKAAPVSLGWPSDHAPALKLRVRGLIAERPGRVRRLLAGGMICGLVCGGAALAYADQPSAPDQLPGEVVGVVGSGDQLGLKIAIDQQVRTLNPGDEYRDGWTVKSITPSTATLSRGEETRTVGLNLTGAVTQAARSAPSEVTVVGLDLQAAIAAGDVASIMRLKGSPMDVIAAQRAVLAKDPDALLRQAGTVVVNGVSRDLAAVPLSKWMATIDENLAAGHQPIFINDNGRTQMAFPNDQGRLASFTSISGMNEPGAQAVGIPYAVPAPDTSALDRLIAQNQAMQAARVANGGLPPAAPSPEQQAAMRQSLEAASQATAARLGITPPRLPTP